MIAFADRLRACLESQLPPRTQTWLAEKSGVPASTISRIMKRDRNATTDVIESIAPVLGFEPIALVKDTDAEARYLESGELIKRSMYDAAVSRVAEYETRVDDLEAKLKLSAELRAKDHAGLSRAHADLARAEHDRSDAREENRRLAESNREYRMGLSRAVTEIANLQAKLKMLGEELGTTKKSSRAAAILAGVAAFTGVVTVASLLRADDEPDLDDEQESEIS